MKNGKKKGTSKGKMAQHMRSAEEMDEMRAKAPKKGKKRAK
jgi:hypothetical protein